MSTPINGYSPTSSARGKPKAAGAAKKANQVTPQAKMSAQARGHGEDGRKVAAIEATLGEIAGDKRREGIGHQEAARRTEEAQEPLRQRSARGKHGQARDARQEIERLARKAEACAEGRAADEHDHRLKRERNWRERYGKAHLSRDGGQHRHEKNRGRADGPRRVGAR